MKWHQELRFRLLFPTFPWLLCNFFLVYPSLFWHSLDVSQSTVKQYSAVLIDHVKNRILQMRRVDICLVELSLTCRIRMLPPMAAAAALPTREQTYPEHLWTSSISLLIRVCYNPLTLPIATCLAIDAFDKSVKLSFNHFASLESPDPSAIAWNM